MCKYVYVTKVKQFRSELSNTSQRLSLFITLLPNGHWHVNRTVLFRWISLCAHNHWHIFQSGQLWVCILSLTGDTKVLASYLGPIQLSVACSMDFKWRKVGWGLGTRVLKCPNNVYIPPTIVCLYNRWSLTVMFYLSEGYKEKWLIILSPCIFSLQYTTLTYCSTDFIHMQLLL